MQIQSLTPEAKRLIDDITRDLELPAAQGSMEFGDWAAAALAKLAAMVQVLKRMCIRHDEVLMKLFEEEPDQNPDTAEAAQDS